MSSHSLLPNGDVLWTTDRGEALVHRPVESVIVVTVKGHATMGLYPALVGDAEELIRRGQKVHLFGDYDGMTGFDDELRVALADFTKQHRTHMEILGLLVTSRIIALGVMLANIVTGGKVTSFSDRALFEETIAAAVRRSQGVPAARR